MGRRGDFRNRKRTVRCTRFQGFDNLDGTLLVDTVHSLALDNTPLLASQIQTKPRRENGGTLRKLPETSSSLSCPLNSILRFLRRRASVFGSVGVGFPLNAGDFVSPMAETLSPNPTTAQRYRSIAARIQSPTSPFFLGSNDDNLERAQARAARAAAIRRRSIAAHAAPLQQEAEPCLGKQQILELFQNCIKLASENVCGLLVPLVFYW